jgi:DNA-binding MarR family transcriptional regulator
MAKDRALRLDGFVPYRLSITSNAVSDVIASAYRALFGLNVPQWRLITVLAELGSASQLQLGAATRMDKVTVSRAAIGLFDRGLVRRSPNPEDKRSHLLTLTREGRMLYDQVAPKALALEDAILAGFSREEVASLLGMLQRLQDAASQLTDDQD